MRKLIVLKKLSILFFLVAIMPCQAMAASNCAEVKIEIKQELTLERQAFDAHMRINNGLTNTSLNNVTVNITFEDEEGNVVLATNDPDNTNAVFFIRKDSGGISNFSNGKWNIEPVAPASSSDLHWLIIPAPGSADGIQKGKLFYVGAVMTYSIGGEENQIAVTPDYIFVKPLPQLELDYFLEENVYGDDAFTQAIEPPVPFTLGVRVKNFGNNVAKNLKIDSAQPKIVENKQGLAIGFEIKECQVNGTLFPNSLLADFGDIQPDTAGVARWIMTCSLSGRFVEFDAIVTHADELGGELTSLLKQENLHAHLLVKDILVDSIGRDQIHDFLAKNGDILRVFESDCIDTDVNDQSIQSTIGYSGTSGTQITYKIDTPYSNDFIYIKLSDPRHGNMMLKETIRNDGKQIKLSNAWLSKERKENPENGWNYYVNIFDVNSTGPYNLIFDEMSSVPHAPVLQAILDKTCAEEERISFIVEASDADGTIPSISLSDIPAGAKFTGEGNGMAVFDWTPELGQAGEYILTFIASDGVLEDTEVAKITVFPTSDKDGDGMNDQWEMDHFGNLDRNGAGDFDGDGIIDYDEFILGTDPTRSDNAPSIPKIRSPLNNTVVTVTTPFLIINNSTDDDGDNIFYQFEIYSDINFTDLVASDDNVPQGSNTTSFQPQTPLNNNTHYYWRVRATDKTAYSFWVYGKFSINTSKKNSEALLKDHPINPHGNDIPLKPTIKNPGQHAWSETLKPEISVCPARDLDSDTITYYFELYTDPDCKDLVQEWETTYPKFTPTYNLLNNTIYYFRVLAMDEHGATSGFTDPSIFFVRHKNHAPEIKGTPQTSINEDQLYSFLPTVDDIDPDDSLIFIITNKPLWADFNTFTGKLSGTPTNDDVGISENILITVRDSFGAQDSLESFSITVNNVNDAPQISGTPLTSINENSLYSFVPTATDVDKGDALVFSIANKPFFTTFNITTGELSGTPTNADVGLFENIIISVTDLAGETASLPEFTLTVLDTNTRPVANDDTYYPSEDAAFTQVAPGVLDNDIDDDDDDILTAQLASDVSHGALSLNNDGSFTYTPENNFSGTDYFSYTISDGMDDSNEATVTLIVSGTNDPPTISAIPDQVMQENTAISDILFTIKDSDSPPETFDISVSSDNQALITNAKTVIHELEDIDSGKEYSLSIFPEKDQCGKAFITITIKDDGGKSASTVFELDVRSKSNPDSIKYYMLNPESLNYPINIVSLEYDNQITIGSTTFDLDQFNSKTISPSDMTEADFVQGDAISGTAFFTPGQKEPGTNMLVPESFSGTSFVIPHIRHSHKYFILSPYGEASVHIKNNNQDTSITILKGEVFEFDAGSINPDMSTITSSLPVLISHMGYFNSIPYDAYPVPPVSLEIFGLHLNKTIIGAIEDNTNITVYADNAFTSSFTLNANQYHELEINGSLHELGNAVHIIADKPIAAVQSDYPNGSTATAFFDKSYFGHRYGIPIDAENVIVISYDPDVMFSLLSKSRWPVIEAFSGASNNIPGKFILKNKDLPSWKANLTAGNHILTSKPIYLIYDTKTDEERHNVLGKLQPN